MEKKQQKLDLEGNNPRIIFIENNKIVYFPGYNQSNHLIAAECVDLINKTSATNQAAQTDVTSKGETNLKPLQTMFVISLETAAFIYDEMSFNKDAKRYKGEHDLFHVYQDRTVIDIKVRDIVYIESNKRKLIIHDRHGKVYEMYGKISEQEKYLKIHHFIRVHNSFIVNYRYIKKMKSEMVWLNSPKEGELIALPISCRCKKEVQKQYKAYCLGVNDI